MSKTKGGLFVIRAYCSICGKLLQESNQLTKKRLFATWDAAVIGAASIPCQECNKKLPNYNLNLKVYNRATKVELEPKDIIPKPKNTGTLEEILRAYGSLKAEAQQQAKQDNQQKQEDLSEN